MYCSLVLRDFAFVERYFLDEIAILAKLSPKIWFKVVQSAYHNQLSCTVPKRLSDWSAFLRLGHFRTGVYRANHITSLTQVNNLVFASSSIQKLMLNPLCLMYYVDVPPPPRLPLLPRKLAVSRCPGLSDNNGFNRRISTK